MDIEIQLTVWDCEAKQFIHGGVVRISDVASVSLDLHDKIITQIKNALDNHTLRFGTVINESKP